MNSATQRPDVSIIIPTYNRLWSLPDAVTSCRKGKCSVEIIVIDDGSRDGTWEWLQSRTDVTCLRQPNWGKDWAVNSGFAASRGEYIRFLDSDDFLEPSANDVQLEIARRHASDLVVGGYTSFDEVTGEKHVMPWTKSDDFIAQQLGESGSGHYSAYLFRREFIAKTPHRQEFLANDDRMFILEVALHFPKVSICQESCFIHRLHARGRLQVSHGLDTSVKNWAHFQVYRKAASLLEELGQFTPRRRRAMARVLWSVAHRMAYSHVDDACELVDWIYHLDPDFVVPENGVLGVAYRRLGFRNTERLIAICRAILKSSGLRYRGYRGRHQQFGKSL
jgi:glycosyltransferase involved in cell wall biosynthesis